MPTNSYQARFARRREHGGAFGAAVRWFRQGKRAALDALAGTLDIRVS
ncbi:MAG: hypothetical protein ACR2K0_02305 [Acidimicrobiales bacterium]